MVRVDALLGRAVGVDVAVGLPTFPLRASLTAITPRPDRMPTASDLMWRAGTEWRHRTVGDFTIDVSVGAGAIPLAMLPGPGLDGTYPFASAGGRFTWRSAPFHLALAPHMAISVGPMNTGDVVMPTFLGTLSGLLPPFLELGWHPGPGLAVTARSSLSYLGLRLEL